MGRRDDETEPQRAEQEFNRLTVEHLQPLVMLLDADPPKKKGELVAILTRAMTNPARVRALYDQLDSTAQLAVREATHDPRGRYSRTKFVAKYGREPAWREPIPKPESYWGGRHRSASSLLVLFFPHHEFLPADLRAILRQFVQAPDPFRIRTCAEPPTKFTLVRPSWDRKNSDEIVPVRVRETAREAEADLPAVLRLIDAGKVRVTDKKRVPTEASRTTVAGVLTGGDFYVPDDENDPTGDSADDLAIKAFAWPMLVQAAGLAEKRGDALKLTSAGRSALTRPPAEVLDRVWATWQKTHLLDEYARIDVVKGQGRASLSAVTTRRKAVLDVLKDCPPGEWFAIDDFWAFMRGAGRGFSLVGERAAWELYLFEQEYGSLGYDDPHAWEQFQGGSFSRSCSSTRPRSGCSTSPTSRRRTRATIFGTAGGPMICPASAVTTGCCTSASTRSARGYWGKRRSTNRRPRGRRTTSACWRTWTWSRPARPRRRTG